MTGFLDPRLFGEAFVTLFVIMDPPGTVPLFLALTGGHSRRARGRAAWQAVAVAFGVITAFAIAGQQILEYLGIGIPALQDAAARGPGRDRGDDRVRAARRGVAGPGGGGRRDRRRAPRAVPVPAVLERH